MAQLIIVYFNPKFELSKLLKFFNLGVITMDRKFKKFLKNQIVKKTNNKTLETFQEVLFTFGLFLLFYILLIIIR